MRHIQESFMDDDRFDVNPDPWEHVHDVHVYRGVPESSRHAENIARAIRVNELHTYKIPYPKRRSWFRMFAGSPVGVVLSVTVITVSVVVGLLTIARWLS